MSEPIVSLPNALTLARIPLAGAVWIAPGDVRWVLALMVIAAVTDVLDGRVARYLHARRGDALGPESVGAWLDPACDKLFIASAVAAIAVSRGASVETIVLIGTRELLVLPLVAVYHLAPGLRRGRRFDFRASWAGKLTTAAQLAAATSLLLAPRLTLPLAIAAAATGGWAVAGYLHRAQRLRA